LFGALLLTLLPTAFQPLALYKTFAAGSLLVASFLYLPQGIYGALVQVVNRLVRAPKARDEKRASKTSAETQ
jgi:branched-chain amino acid transport system permease protein